ncbi:isoprenylcysteine carboxylmethyltransferase family protein [Candidatus Sumerlaeota bacterium]|nr:isoprenylcysteine carboxylmethyltransferase family protein [Candidatus Sumerlaeota bacterium]
MVRNKRILNWVRRHRGILVALPLIVTIVCFAHESEWDALLWPLGMAILALGVIIRIWAQQHVRRRVHGPRHLAKTGPYALVRNPIYIANILLCVSATVFSELLWFIPITICWSVFVYSLVVRYEEMRLLRKYGDAYREYMAAVPRWIPRFVPLTSANGFNRHCYANIVSEIHCLAIVLPYLLKEIISPWFER